jgi:predicted nucleic acid-binding protein
MILVDTSVVIAYQRTADPKLAKLLRTLPVALCGVTRAEVLHGVRSSAEHANVLILLNAFLPLSIADALWDQVGDNLAVLRAGGLTIPFPDAVLASAAIANGIELWTRDRHFTLVQQLLPALKLFPEPP